MLPSWPNHSIKEYLDLLQAPDSHQRAQAAAALEALNAQEAVEPLIRALTDMDKNVRVRVAEALGKLKNTLAVPPLIQLLEDPAWEVRAQAARSLDMLGDRRAVLPLCKLLADQEGDVNYHVSIALGHLADPGSLQPLIEVLLEGEQHRSLMAGHALINLGDIILEPVLAALHHPSGPARRFAVMTLPASLKDERVTRALVTVLEQDPDYQVKREAYRRLEAQGNIFASDQIELQKQIDKLLDQYKLEDLGRANFEQAIPWLTHPDQYMRTRAAMRLGELQDRRAIEPLLLALSDSSDEVRGRVVVALGKLDDEQVVEPLINALEDKGLEASIYSYNGLNQLGKKAVPKLIVALENKSVWIRIRAASLLGDIGDTSALPALYQIEQNDTDSDPTLGTVKDMAARAIRSLTMVKPLPLPKDIADLEVIGTEQAEDNWRKLLTNWSKLLLNSNDLRQPPSPAALDSQWLGRSGASEEQIASAESRLGRKLPPSYRDFLKVTNGWVQVNPSIEQLWSVEEIDWFAVRNQDWIDAWQIDDLEDSSDEEYFVYGTEQSVLTMRNQYLKTALEISPTGDSAIVLLNPQIVTAEGEWEAWFFANWLPGACRYRSFGDLMRENYQELYDSLQTAED